MRARVGQLSRLHVANHAFEIAPADTSIEQGLAFAHNAVRLDPSSQRARAALAFALLVKDETAAGLAETESALALNPETLVYLEMIGWLLSLLGEWDRGTALVRKAIARNPHHMPIAHSRALGGPPPARRGRGGLPGGPALPRHRVLLAQPHAGLLPRAPGEARRGAGRGRRAPPDEARLRDAAGAR